MGLDQVGFQPHRLAKASLALGPLVLRDERAAQRAVPLGILRLVTHRATERRDGVVELSDRLVRLPEPHALPRVGRVHHQTAQQEIDQLQVLVGHDP